MLSTCKLSCKVCNLTLNVAATYNLAPGRNITDGTYYRIATSTNINRTKINSIFNSVVSAILSKPTLKNLNQEKPVYLFGANASSFSEFDAFKGMKTVDGTRLLLDVAGFATNPPYPGFMSTSFSGCSTAYTSESIVVHEFLHTIHL